MDRPDHVQPAASSSAVFVFDFFLVLTTAVVGIGTLVWIRFRRFPPILAAHEQRLARAALLQPSRSSRDPEATIRRRGGGASHAAPPPLSRPRAEGPRDADRDPPVRRRPPAAGRPARHDAADRPGDPLRRLAGSIAELAFARGARIEPHSNPNTTWFIVIEGGGWVARRRRADADRGRRGRPCGRPTRSTRRGPSTRQMRAFVVELAGADDGGPGASSTASPCASGPGLPAVAAGQGAIVEPDRPIAPRPGSGGAALAGPPRWPAAGRYSATSAPSWLRIRAVAPQTARPSIGYAPNRIGQSPDLPFDHLHRRTRQERVDGAARRSGRPRPRTGPAPASARRAATIGVMSKLLTGIQTPLELAEHAHAGRDRHPARPPPRPRAARSRSDRDRSPRRGRPGKLTSPL